MSASGWERQRDLVGRIRVEARRSEAAERGDRELVELCDRALAGDERSRAQLKALEDEPEQREPAEPIGESVAVDRERRGAEARRQWALLVDLVRHPGLSAVELAERHRTTSRTVRRDLTALARALGVDVVRRADGSERLYEIADPRCPLCGADRPPVPPRPAAELAEGPARKAPLSCPCGEAAERLYGGDRSECLRCAARAARNGRCSSCRLARRRLNHGPRVRGVVVACACGKDDLKGVPS